MIRPHAELGQSLLGSLFTSCCILLVSSVLETFAFTILGILCTFRFLIKVD